MVEAGDFPNDTVYSIFMKKIESNTWTTVRNRHQGHLEIWCQRTEERMEHIVVRVSGNDTWWGIFLEFWQFLLSNRDIFLTIEDFFSEYHLQLKQLKTFFAISWIVRWRPREKSAQSTFLLHENYDTCKIRAKRMGMLQDFCKCLMFLACLLQW